MKHVLLTGGRAPATLDLARCLARAGHRVSIAESFPYHLSRYSRAVWKNFQLPPPRDNPDLYIQTLADILRDHAIDLLIPTCEEIFWIARGGRQLTDCCDVLADDFSRVTTLHNKWEFIRLAQSYDLPAPATILLTDPRTAGAQMLQWQASRERQGVVLKPVFSRFASRTCLFPAGVDAGTTLPDFGGQAWVAQEFLRGPAYCTYSIARRGRLVAHATYGVTFQVGVGSAICFPVVDHDGCRAWVEEFVARSQFCGQIAFDFIESDGQVWALECNPRLTSGVHLLTPAEGFSECFLGEPTEVITPPPQRTPIVRLPMLLWGAASIRSLAQGADWLKQCLTGRDVTFRWFDPLPALDQFISLAGFWRISRRVGVSLTEATTHDMDWNGDQSPRQ